MSSIVEGYNYDIFISYRQKDNKYDGWVSRFVENLKKELEATFKEEINVYFDVNPHDGLLETHDVDESLKEKLKCLVFIPIISRTYCDPKAFAWEHEFRAFVEQASQDQFGLKVKLTKGNVSSRVLPVRIHDLEGEDLKLFETVSGGVLRGIEFIYKEPGVNKALTEDDDEKKNLNHSKYRIQVNKVANAIDEIISGLKAAQLQSANKKSISTDSSGRKIAEKRIPNRGAYAYGNWKRALSVLAIVAALIVSGILLYLKIFTTNDLKGLISSDGKISVAVMPFRNMTNESTWNVWQDAIKDNVITYLTNFTEELTVKQSESVLGILQSRGLTNYASITPAVAGTVAQKLDANVFVSGSINQAGSTIRVNAQLYNARTEEAIQSFQIEGNSEEEIFQMIDSLSGLIKDFLIISVMEKNIVTDFRPLISTRSPEAYQYYVNGSQVFYDDLDYPAASEWYLKAVEVDTNFTEAIRMLAYAYVHQGMNEEAKKWILTLYRKRDRMSPLAQLYANVQYASYFETIYEGIKYWTSIVDYDEQLPVPYGNLAGLYFVLKQYDQAIALSEKQLEIYDRWNIRPRWIVCYTQLGEYYHITGQYRKERELYRKAEQDFPDDVTLLARQAILALSEKKTDEADQYIGKFVAARRADGISESSIAGYMGLMYEEADMLDKAEEYYRKAQSLEPENPGKMNLLAWFLVNTDRNVNEGLELIENALEIIPDNFNYLDTKGWGLYKQGKNEEALETLQKSWDLKPWQYDHELYLRIEEVKKATSG